VQNGSRGGWVRWSCRQGTTLVLFCRLVKHYLLIGEGAGSLPDFPAPFFRGSAWRRKLLHRHADRRIRSSGIRRIVCHRESVRSFVSGLVSGGDCDDVLAFDQGNS